MLFAEVKPKLKLRGALPLKLQSLYGLYVSEWSPANFNPRLGSQDHDFLHARTLEEQGTKYEKLTRLAKSYVNEEAKSAQ